MKYTKEILQNAVDNSSSVSDVVRYFGLQPTGSHNRHLKSRIAKFKIDTSHFQIQVLNGRSNKKVHFSEMLVFNRIGRRETTSKLRRAMLEYGFEEVCSECNLGLMWNNKPIRIQIDHKDGDGLNNLPDNLRFLCPNCHSQTETYAAKNVKNEKVLKCSNKTKISSSRKPDKDVLQSLVFEKPTTKIAIDFGVSDKAVEKWCKSYDIQKPPRGYWAKLASRV